jgi:hypothetical protein
MKMPNRTGSKRITLKELELMSNEDLIIYYLNLRLEHLHIYSKETTRIKMLIEWVKNLKTPPVYSASLVVTSAKIKGNGHDPMNEKPLPPSMGRTLSLPGLGAPSPIGGGVKSGIPGEYEKGNNIKSTFHAPPVTRTLEAEAEIGEAYQAYAANGRPLYTATYIQRYYHCSQAEFYRILKKKGIPTRAYLKKHKAIASSTVANMDKPDKLDKGQ